MESATKPLSIEEVTDVFGLGVSLGVYEKLCLGAESFRKLAASTIKKFMSVHAAIECSNQSVYYVDELGFWIAAGNNDFIKYADILNKLTLYHVKKTNLSRSVMLFCDPNFADRLESILKKLEKEPGSDTLKRDGSTFTSVNTFQNHRKKYNEIVEKVGKYDPAVASSIFIAPVFGEGHLEHYLDMRTVGKKLEDKKVVVEDKKPVQGTCTVAIGSDALNPQVTNTIQPSTNDPLEWFANNERKINESNIAYYFRWMATLSEGHTLIDSVVLYLLTNTGNQTPIIMLASCRKTTGKDVPAGTFISVLNTISPTKYDVAAFLEDCATENAIEWARKNKPTRTESFADFLVRCDAVAYKFRRLIAWVRFNNPSVGLHIADYRERYYGSVGVPFIALADFRRVVYACGYSFTNEICDGMYLCM